MPDTPDTSTLALLESALTSGGFPALHDAAIQLRDAGLTQNQLHQLFDTLRARHQHDTGETKYDAILDTMDYITGSCDPKMRLYPSKNAPHTPPT